MIAHMFNNKKLNPVVTELFIRGRKFNISTVLISQLFFKVTKKLHIFLSWKLPIKENFSKLL